jgi:BirA family biotin operon repressor/biotin-[acetyl-CoA-carboxylase] ligase
LEILYFNELSSTQQYLIDGIKSNTLSANTAIVALSQTNGIGSRGNSWIAKKGDLTFSFAIDSANLPDDLPISSASIYFGFLFKEILKKYQKNIFLKWPNDIYIDNAKCGGIVTHFVKNIYIVGIGVNLVPRDDLYAYIDAKNAHLSIVESYFLLLKKAPKWQEIFSKFRLEFKNSFGFKVNTKSGKVDLSRAKLCKDGSIIIDDERIYSLR